MICGVIGISDTDEDKKYDRIIVVSTTYTFQRFSYSSGIDFQNIA